jgi:hypothetical protein
MKTSVVVAFEHVIKGKLLPKKVRQIFSRMGTGKRQVLYGQ